MNKLLYIITITISLFVLSGCGNGFSKETYTYQNNESDPTLVFTSDYEEYTYFWLNNDSPSEERLCSNTHPIGFLLQTDSIFFFDKPVTKLDVKVPSNQEITIMGSYNGNTSCGPINKAFIPEKNKTYVVHYEKAGNYCRMNIIDKNTGNDVPTKQSNMCIK